MTSFEQVLQKYRDISFSERDKGYRFERLMQAYLKTDPYYADILTEVWLWNEFPSRNDFGAGDKDLGIDLVTRTKNGGYWAVQCKCYKEDAVIDKPKVDTFLSTSGKSFYDTHEAGKKVNFAYRLWIDTTKKGFNNEAKITIQSQTPEVGHLGYYNLINAAVDWQKLDDGLSGKNAAVEKYEPKKHQQIAVSNVHDYLKINDRGKLIMACGTGKTFTSLCIAENETQKDGLILFLVPSIALLGQTLREWKNQCTKPIHAICICSDITVSKSSKKDNDDDVLQMSVTDLALPASTVKENITHQYHRACIFQRKEGGNIVIFSTYQSIDVISSVQKSINRQDAATGCKDSFIFDLIICDEAHRTTGVTLSNKDESAFVKVHDNMFLKSKKRIYMTATPRLYSEAAKTKAKEASAELCSMDDTALYGEEMYRIGFGEAVDRELLSDYKVIVLTMEEDQLDEDLRKSIKENKNIEINTENALKLIGCINALSKKSLIDKELFEGADPSPMKSAVAFCQSIAVSKATAEAFMVCWEKYISSLKEEQRSEIVNIQTDHVDGTMGAYQREQKLHWLKSADSSKRECNILNNVRCLSEGVDVPSLDAVMFLSARNSQIDVVQSVGRVMRKAEGKAYGYIIIPVVVAPSAEPEKVLSSDRFKVVWTVLNALRAHDDRFNATINKIELNKKKSPPNIVVIDGYAVDDDSNSGSNEGKGIEKQTEDQLKLNFTNLQNQIYAKIVQKCGTRFYWEQWASDVAKIAEQHIIDITAIVSKKGNAKKEFDLYLTGLRKNINPAVTEQEAIEMLAQHIITQPVFEALFEDYSFVKNNTVSKSLEGIITALNEQSKKEDVSKLEKFYFSVRQRAEGIDNSEAKQKIIVELYDKFFRTAFPKVTEKLGIVYTPVEIVDFIIHSVEDVLQKEFERSMSDENVHILDPFTGTGTFITRLLQSGIIRDEDLKRKYTKEIHANEIVLLAYYIASINIENVYHELMRSREWKVERKDSGFTINSGYEHLSFSDNYSIAAEREPKYNIPPPPPTHTTPPAQPQPQRLHS
jgi:predicted helicase